VSLLSQPGARAAIASCGIPVVTTGWAIPRTALDLGERPSAVTYAAMANLQRPPVRGIVVRAQPGVRLRIDIVSRPALLGGSPYAESIPYAGDRLAGYHQVARNGSWRLDARGCA
jgi:hypothetical protein